jgi:hypothetical protein
LSFVIPTLPVWGQGSFLALHQGANDPGSEGFTLSTNGNSHYGPVASDLGLTAWSTQVTASRIHYGQTLTEFDGSDWVLSVVMRVVTLDHLGAFRVGLSTGQRSLGVSFGTTAEGDPVAIPFTGTSTKPAIVLNGAGPSYHDYQLVYSAATQTASFWIDGVKREDGLAGWEWPVTPNISWTASYQNPLPVEANWHRVSLQIIPEPSAFAHLAVGGGWLWAVRRRIRRSDAGVSSP